MKTSQTQTGPIRPTGYVSIEWRIRAMPNGAEGTWTIYENKVREEIADRFVRNHNSLDPMFEYRMKL